LRIENRDWENWRIGELRKREWKLEIKRLEIKRMEKKIIITVHVVKFDIDLVQKIPHTPFGKGGIRSEFKL
jgi:hypothetical protein